jgi:hypothetical protein
VSMVVHSNRMARPQTGSGGSPQVAPVALFPVVHSSSPSSQVGVHVAALTSSWAHWVT